MGVFVGPCAHECFWDGLPRRLLERADDVRALTSGLTMKIRSFGAYCTSLLAFRLQFCPPSPSICSSYRQASQRITATPWNSLPHSVLTALKELSFPFEIVDLERLSLASRARVAATSSSFRTSWDRYSLAWQSDDRLLLPPFPAWRRGSCLMHLHTALGHFQARPCAVPLLEKHPRDLQRQLHAILRADPLPRRNLAAALLRRICKRWVAAEPAAIAGAIFSFFGFQSGGQTLKLPLRIRMAVLLATFDAWPTKSRMQERLHPCRFGCGSGSRDIIDHLLVCPKVQHFGVEHFGINYADIEGQVLERLIAALPLGAQGCKVAIYIDLVLAAYRSAIHNSNGDVVAAMVSRLKHLLLLRPRLRTLFPAL